jgi:hypothetical protein
LLAVSTLSLTRPMITATQVIARISSSRMPPGRTWRDRATGLVRATRQALLDEPTLAMLYIQRAGRGPNAIQLARRGLQIYRDAGIPLGPTAEAFRVMRAYTVGFVAFELGRSAGSGPPLPALPADPELVQLAQVPGDTEFNVGLEWLLDGIATRIED